MLQPIILSHFKKQLKRYGKKYPDITQAVYVVLKKFLPQQHVHLGNGVYKVRLRIPSLQKGKSKSFRMIVLVMEVEGYLVPVALYFKGDQQNLTKKEINEQLEMILFELSAQSLIK